MRFGSTAKVLLKCKLKYYRISECVDMRQGHSRSNMIWCSRLLGCNGGWLLELSFISHKYVACSVKAG